MYKSLLILLILLPLNLKAQVTIPGAWSDKVSMDDLQHNLYQQYALPDDGLETKGSPYLFDDYRKGDIYFSNQSKALDLLIKFNCYTEQLFYLYEGKEYYFSSDQLDIFFIRSQTDSTVHAFKNIFVKSRKKRLFFEVLYEGSVFLLKRYDKEFIEADYTQAYNAGRTYHEYLDKNKYYIQSDEGDIIRFRPGNKQVIKLLKDRSEELEDHIRRKNLDAGNEKELIELFSYYDSLKE